MTWKASIHFAQQFSGWFFFIQINLQILETVLRFKEDNHNTPTPTTHNPHATPLPHTHTHSHRERERERNIRLQKLHLLKNKKIRGKSMEQGFTPKS